MTEVIQKQVDFHMPKLDHKFRVNFLDKNGHKFYFNDKLAEQVIKVGDFELSNNRFTCPQSLEITFSDDNANFVSTYLRELLEEDKFEIQIETFGLNNPVNEIISFTNVRLENINHSGFSYEPSDISYLPEINIQFPSPEYDIKTSQIIDSLSDEAKALYFALRNFNIQISKPNKHADIRRTAFFSYSEATFIDCIK